MKLDYQRYEEIKEIIASMFEQLNIRCVPINCFEIATRMNIKLIPYSYFSKEKRLILEKKSSDGFSTMDNNKNWKIFYNDFKHYDRINSTLMHEIGHIVLNHSEDSDLAESEVKFFSKYALAPPVLVHKFNCKSPTDIVMIFDISYEASLYAWEYYQKWLRYASNKGLLCDVRIWYQVINEAC